MTRHLTETAQGGPSYQADATWWLPQPLRRALLLTPPFALAVLEIFHPQPDVNAKALLDASAWFAWFHVIQLVLTGLVALTVLLLAADFGRATAWTTRLGVGVFLVFFSAYDTIAGIGTGLAMHSARNLSAEQQAGVFTVVKNWPGLGPTFALSIVGTLGWVVAVGTLALAARRLGASRPEWITLALAAVFLLGGHPFPQGTPRLWEPLRCCALSRMAIRIIRRTAWQEIIRTRRSTAMKRRLR
jgi:hypothetical protein